MLSLSLELEFKTPARREPPRATAIDGRRRTVALYNRPEKNKIGFLCVRYYRWLKGLFSEADARPSPSGVRTAWTDEISGGGGRERRRRFLPFLRGHPGLA